MDFLFLSIIYYSAGVGIVLIYIVTRARARGFTNGQVVGFALWGPFIWPFLLITTLKLSTWWNKRF